MTPQQLRNSILQMAIEGKLVEQRPEEGTGEELYQLIQEEKQELIKSGKLKKQKELPEITEDEIPFEIPASWKWVRLSECLDVRDGTHDTPQYVEKGIPLVTSKNLVNGKIDFSTCKMISLEDYLKFSERSKVDINDILFAMIGSIGNPVLVSDENKFSIKNMALFKNTYKNIDMNYLYWFLCYSQRAMKIKASGGVQSFVSLTFLREFLFPLPPIEEQMRIVEKIEAIFPIIDRYESTWQKLNELNKKFPEELQKSILQEAIQGKLCRQNENDGSAQELIEKILLEKERLIETGQIKKQKDLPPIQEDEIPFDIPENWEWIRLSECIDVRDGTHETPKYVSKGVPLVTSKNLVNGKIDFSTCKEISLDDHKKFSERSNVDNDDILFAMIGSIGNPVLVRKTNEFSIKNMALFKNTYKYINMKFLFLFLLFSQGTMKRKASGGVQSFVSLAFLRSFLFPLPPVLEQSRIVTKVDNIILTIENYKKIFK